MEGQAGGNLLGPEGTGIFPFVQQFDPAHPNAVVVEVEFLRVIDGMTDLDSLADIGGRDLVEGALKADGGIVIDDSFMADEEDFIQFGPGEPADGDTAGGGLV